MSLNVYIEELVLCHPDTKAFSTQKPYIVVKTVPFYENREQLCSITQTTSRISYSIMQ